MNWTILMVMIDDRNLGYVGLWVCLKLGHSTAMWISVERMMINHWDWVCFHTHQCQLIHYFSLLHCIFSLLHGCQSRTKQTSPSPLCCSTACTHWALQQAFDTIQDSETREADTSIKYDKILSFCGWSFSPQIQGHLGTKNSDFAVGPAPSRHIEISEDWGFWKWLNRTPLVLEFHKAGIGTVITPWSLVKHHVAWMPHESTLIYHLAGGCESQRCWWKDASSERNQGCRSSHGPYGP